MNEDIGRHIRILPWSNLTNFKWIMSIRKLVRSLSTQKLGAEIKKALSTRGTQKVTKSKSKILCTPQSPLVEHLIALRISRNWTRRRESFKSNSQRPATKNLSHSRYFAIAWAKGLAQGTNPPQNQAHHAPTEPDLHTENWTDHTYECFRNIQGTPLKSTLVYWNQIARLYHFIQINSTQLK